MKTTLVQSFVDNRQRQLTDNIARSLDELCALAPRFCASALAHSETHVSQKAQLLGSLVRSSFERQRIVDSLHGLPTDELVFVVDGLRRLRLNGRRARSIGLTAVVGHRQFTMLAANHRQRLRRVFKHLLGERTWATVCRSLEVVSPSGDEFLERVILRFANDKLLVRESLCFLAGIGFDIPQAPRWGLRPWLQRQEQSAFAYTDEHLRKSVAARTNLAFGEGMSRETLSGIRGTFHGEVSVNRLRELSAPVSRRGRVDGVLTAAIKDALTSGKDVSLKTIASEHTVASSSLGVSASIVLDLSASSMSSGERLYHPAALGMALVARLQAIVRELLVYQVGGSQAIDGDGLPRPHGASDIATAILEAAETRPDVILVVSDGFENHRQGDSEQVMAGLRRLGLGTAIYHVVPVFSVNDDLSQRRLGRDLPVVPLAHEESVGDLSARLLLGAEPAEVSPGTLQTVEDLLFGGV